MATLSAFSTLAFITVPRKPNSHLALLSHLQAQDRVLSTVTFRHVGFRSSFQKGHKGGSFLHGTRRLSSTEVEEAVAPPEEEEEQQQAVSVPVSPSDTLTMFFQAEGTMNEDAIPKVTQVLEGISDLQVKVFEGIASVELTKRTTVQATGVASGLVELIQDDEGKQMLFAGVVASSASSYLVPSCFSPAELLSSIPGNRVLQVGKGWRNTGFTSFTSRKRPRWIACASESKWASSLEARPGVWEDPDEGSDSDSEDEDEETEENGMYFENDSDEESDDVVTSKSTQKFAPNNSEEMLMKEVEQLLEPEERSILQQNAIPNLRRITTAKWKPLHSVALSAQMRCMDQLLGAGLDIESVDQDGRTPLHIAIIGKKEAVISHLLRKRANPEARDRDGASPLHYAAQVGAMQTVKLLIKYKVDVNVADNEGWTPLHVAVQTRNRDITKVLLVNGADTTMKTMDGRTPLDLSLCYGKNFKSYDLAKLVKIIPANRDLYA